MCKYICMCRYVLISNATYCKRPAFKKNKQCGIVNNYFLSYKRKYKGGK